MIKFWKWFADKQKPLPKCKHQWTYEGTVQIRKKGKEETLHKFQCWKCKKERLMERIS